MYFGTPPIVKNGLITYLDSGNYLSFTGSLTGSFIERTEIVTFISSSSVTIVFSESISESYYEEISESFSFVTSSSVIGFETIENIIGYITSSSVIGQTTEVTSYTVTNDGSSAYVFNGTGSNPTIDLIRGTTYTFTVNAPGHPFWIKSVSSTGTGSTYDEGVAGNGEETGSIIWDVSESAPSILYYNCQYHSSMAGTFNISDGPFVGEDIISESYEPIISESLDPIISESIITVVSQSTIVVTESAIISTPIEITSSFLIPSASISESILLVTASFIDISGNGNTGSFINDPVYVDEQGGYFQFNGNSNTVSIPHSTSSYDFTDNITVGGWVKINSFVTPKAFLSKYIPGVGGLEFGIEIDQKIHLQGETSLESFDITSSADAEIDTWYNVVGVKSGSTLILYVNGLRSTEYTLESGSGTIDNTGSISLASRASEELFFGGSVANFFLYNRVLNDSEILQNYKSLVTRYF